MWVSKVAGWLTSCKPIPYNGSYGGCSSQTDYCVKSYGSLLKSATWPLRFHGCQVVGVGNICPGGVAGIAIVTPWWLVHLECIVLYAQGFRVQESGSLRVTVWGLVLPLYFAVSNTHFLTWLLIAASLSETILENDHLLSPICTHWAWVKHIRVN